MKLLRLSLILICCLTTTAFAATTFVEGQDYQAITQPSSDNLIKGKVSVIEFFSYGCHYCYQFEPTLEKWLKTKPSYIEFRRIPVAFSANWDIYSKAFYIAKALEKEKQITPALFDAIQKQEKTLDSETAMGDFFAKHGVKHEDFINALNYSPTIAMQVKQGENLTRQFQIYAIPTVVVNGKYKTDMKMAQGPERFIEIIEFLIAKEK